MNQEKQSAGANIIVRGTLIIIAVSLLSKLLGFSREMVMAYQFGATGVVDAYIVAYTIPYLFMAIVGPALSTVIVPVYNEYMTAGKREEACKTFSTLFTILGLILVLFTIVGMALPEKIVNLVAPGLPEDTARLAFTLTLVMLPAMIFLGLNNLFAGLLNANNIFGPSAATPAISSIFIIIAAMGRDIWGIQGVAAGTVLGILAGAVVLLPFLKKTGFVFRMSLNIRDPGVGKCFKLILPVIIGAGITQIYIIINRMLASGLPEGSISALNYAYIAVMLPYGLYVNALRTSIFPTLSSHISAGRYDEMIRVLERGCKVVSYITLPILAGFLILGTPFVQLIYERGAFGQNAVEMTSAALFFYSFGLLGICINPLLIRGFHALQDMRTPVYVGLISVLINVGLSLLFINSMKHAGLALANSIAINFSMLSLIWFLSRKQERCPSVNRDIIQWLCLLLGATFIMAVSVALLDRVLAAWLTGAGMNLLSRVMLDIILGAVVFFACSRCLRLPEYDYLFDLFAQGLRRIGLDFLARFFVRRPQD